MQVAQLISTQGLAVGWQVYNNLQRPGVALLSLQRTGLWWWWGPLKGFETIVRGPQGTLETYTGLPPPPSLVGSEGTTPSYVTPAQSPSSALALGGKLHRALTSSQKKWV